jgi:eukaryotic-like serine/threonine-protein kinase
VLIECPNCRHSIRVVDLRPGRFTPRCPRCEQLFQLTVSERTGSKPVVTGFDASVFAEPVAQVALGPAQPESLVVDWPVMSPERGASVLRPRRLPGGIPRLLGGHLVLRLLGHGPRGRVVLAEPLSLEQPAVLKLLAADRAADTIFLANLTREAFAAAQIEHPNLVPVRELGRDRGHHYTSLDWIDGPSGAQLLESRGTLEPYQAAVVVLQAARGLKAAHEQGLLHRDVKPANLRLDASGRVMVDDLGLEMTPSLAAALEARQKSVSEPRKRVATGNDQSLRPAAGTPAFMAPEQAANPLTCDGRADIYALGVTFYNLVTGKLPYSGDDAVELIRQHQEELPVPPGEFVPNLPRQISDIIRTMMGKRPEERYPNMAVVVDLLEGLLGVHGDPDAAVVEDASGTIRRAADTLARSAARRLRFRILALSAAIWLGLIVLLFSLGLGQPVFGMLAFGALTALAALIASGFVHNSELLHLARAVVLGGGLRSWLIATTGALAAIAALWLWGGFLPWFLILCGGSLVGTFLTILDRPLAAERKLVIDSAKELLKRLRTRGQDEAAIQELVALHGGNHCEKLFERVFGRSALLSFRARQDKAGSGPRRRRFNRWRDAIYLLLAKHLQGRRDHRHLRLLQEVEEKRLEAAGLNLLTARRRARRIGKAMLVTAVQWREEQRILDLTKCSTATHGPTLLQRLSIAASQPEPVLEPHEKQPNALLRRIDTWTGILLGRGLRFPLGAALAVLLAIWMDAKGILTVSQVREQAAELYRVSRGAVESADPAFFRQLKWKIPWEWHRLAEPLDFPWIVDFLGRTLPAFNLVVAATILIFSLFSRRRVTGLLALVGSLVALFGPRWGLAVPALLERVDANAQARGLGILIVVMGWLWPRRKSS